MTNWLSSCERPSYDILSAYSRNELIGIYQGWVYFHSWNGGYYLPLEILSRFCLELRYPNLSLRYSKNESLSPLYPLEKILKSLHLGGASIETEVLNSELGRFEVLRWLILDGSDRSELDPRFLLTVPIVDMSLNNCSLDTPLIDDIFGKLDSSERIKGKIDLRNNAAASAASQSSRSNLMDKGWIVYF